MTLNRDIMLFLFTLKRGDKLFMIPSKKLPCFCNIASKSSIQLDVERISKIINDHPFPNQPLQPFLLDNLPPTVLSAKFVETVLGRLFAAQANGLKALEFFRFSLHHSHGTTSPDAFEKTIHILVRMRYFDKAWDLMAEMSKMHNFLLTLKSMSIMLTKIAKFQSYNDTLEAFDRMEKEIFIGRTFSTKEFNVLLRAFCTQREMKEARSVFQRMHSRFPPDTKTMNILLLGFKESGDVTSVELFYHEMVQRGFKPNSVTFNIRIDAYCKKGYLADGLRLFEEMEKAKLLTTLETLTTLIHGAGVARNALKARELFGEIFRRNMQPDVGVYNALISSLIQCQELQSAILLMDEMDEKHIRHDNTTYHTLFFGLLKSKDIQGFIDLYQKMTKRYFVPKARTVVMLIKFFCVNGHLDLGLNLWDYLLEKGCCPHSHALDLLVMGLCSRRRVEEAFKLSIQFLERGMRISESTYRMLERSLPQHDKTDKLRALNSMMTELHDVLPPLRGPAMSDTHPVAVLS